VTEVLKSAAGAAAASSSAAKAGNVRELIDLYMASYAGRDTTRPQRLAWWSARIGDIALSELTDDPLFEALESLEARNGRVYAGLDADGKPIFRGKGKPIAPATINRYAASIAAVVTWAIKKRQVPRGFENPARHLERRPENNERVRFLADDERERLFAACRASKWPRLYLLVLMAITTGARRGELEGLRWGDVDLDKAVAYVEQTKNGDRKVLPLLPAVLTELERFRSKDPRALVFASKRRPAQAYNSTMVFGAALKAAKVKNFRFHDCRHSCASYLAQNGATLLEIADVLGHRQLSVTKRYSHLTTVHKAKLMQRVLGDIR
jgi:integrase